MSTPLTSNPPEFRGEPRACTVCGSDSYAVVTKRPLSDGPLGERTVQDHSDDGTPADADCERGQSEAPLSAADLAVLRAAIEVQGSNESHSPSAGEVRMRAEQLLNAARVVIPFQARSGTYAGIEAEIWKLQSAGYVVIDVGLASPTAVGMPAHVDDEEVGVRATAKGRARVPMR